MVGGVGNDLSQIPLGTQILDWSGLKATDRPSRQSAYPDDFLPTVGLVQGMYNDSAQVINSDGSNNLKVYVVNESGGGGGSGGGIPPMVVADGSAYFNFDVSSGHADIATLPNSVGDYLLAAHFAVSVSGSGLSGAQYELAQLALVDNSNILRIACLSFWFTSGGTPPTPPYQSVELWYPVPINLAESFSSALDTVKIRVFAGGWAVNCNVRLITGNPQT